MNPGNDAAAARKQRLAKALKANIGRRKAAEEPDPPPPDGARSPAESAKSETGD